MNFNKLYNNIIKNLSECLHSEIFEGGNNSKGRVNNPDDEFYTRIEDIEKEFQYYEKYFANKIIYCNCDNPEWSNIYLWLKDNFNRLNIKKLYSTYYGENTPITVYDGIEEKQFPTKSNGSFDSTTSIEILKKCDIVLSNPPFGPLVNKFVKLLLKYNKDFLCVVPLTIISDTEIIDAFNNEQLFPGYSNITKFNRPDGSTKNAAVCWITTFDTTDKPIKKYNRKQKDPYYISANGEQILNVDYVEHIPNNFDYDLLVPISFIRKINPKKYEILDYIRDVKYNNDPKHARLLIRQK